MNYYLEGKTDYETHNDLLIITKSVHVKIRPILSPNLKVQDPFENDLHVLQIQRMNMKFIYLGNL